MADDERERLIADMEEMKDGGSCDDAAAMLRADGARIKVLKRALQEIVESTLPGMHTKPAFDAIQRARALLEEK